jgi:hypothetical protein
MKKTLKSGAFLLLIFALMCIIMTGCSSESSGTSKKPTPPEVPKSEEKAIISFSIDGNEGIIAEDLKEISVTMPGDTDLQTLKPEITISELATISPDSEEEVDFTNPVTYVVTAEDESTETYVVTVTLAPFTTFSLNLTAQLVRNGNNEIKVYGVPESGIYLSTGNDGPSLLVISVGGTSSSTAVYSEVSWYIDDQLFGGNQNIITIDANKYAYTIPHNLTVIVIEDGVRYSKTLTFTVGKTVKAQEQEEEGEAS